MDHQGVFFTFFQDAENLNDIAIVVNIPVDFNQQKETLSLFPRWYKVLEEVTTFSNIARAAMHHCGENWGEEKMATMKEDFYTLMRNVYGLSAIIVNWLEKTQLQNQYESLVQKIAKTNRAILTYSLDENLLYAKLAAQAAKDPVKLREQQEMYTKVTSEFN